MVNAQQAVFTDTNKGRLLYTYIDIYQSVPQAGDCTKLYRYIFEMKKVGGYVPGTYICTCIYVPGVYAYRYVPSRRELYQAVPIHLYPL